MTSFCFLLIGAIVAFIISRMCKSANMYIGLMCMLLLGFVVGTGLKSAVANVTNNPSNELVVTTASLPTYQGTTAFVGTVDNHYYDMSQEVKEGDDVVTTELSEKVLTMPYNTEIEDDS